MNFFTWLGRKLGLRNKKVPTQNGFAIPKNMVTNNKGALITVINDYPGSAQDLKGCVNDGSDWRGFLKNKAGFSSVCVISDSNCTPDNVKKALTELVRQATPGSHILWQYSGHGTQVPDTNSDEPEARDEALYLYNGILVDDEVKSILTALPQSVRLTVIMDCCHSGSITRMGTNDSEVKARFVPMDDAAMTDKIQGLPLGKTMMKPENDMNEILITGCKDSELSYDASFGGRANGAFTYYALQVLNSNPDATYAEFYTKLRQLLPNSKHPQTPQLEGKEENKKLKMFS